MNPLQRVIDDELAEAAKALPEGQQAAFTCQVVLRFSGPVVGAVRACLKYPETGLYQVLTPARTPDGKQVMAEITFHIDDLVAIGVQRDVSSVVQPGARKIFTPH